MELFKKLKEALEDLDGNWHLLELTEDESTELALDIENLRQTIERITNA